MGMTKDDLKQGVVPDKLKGMFQKEYGIDIGITHLKGNKYGLTYQGETETDLQVSASAKQFWTDILGSRNDKWTLNFTHKYSGDPQVQGGKNVIINLSDYDNNDYAVNFLDFSGIEGSDLVNMRRTVNLARIMEHEIFGHVYYRVSDYDEDQPGFSFGEPLYNYSMTRTKDKPHGQTAWGITNSFRIEMGLREYQRLSYGNGSIDRHGYPIREEGIMFGDPGNRFGKLFLLTGKE